MLNLKRKGFSGGDKIKRKLKAAIKLIRPSHWLIDTPLVLVTIAMIKGFGFFDFSTVVIVLMMMLFHSAAIAWNDVVDVEGDKISRPHRPLVTGVLSKFEGWLIGFSFYAILIGAMFTMNALAASFMAVILIMAILYNYGIRAKDSYLFSGAYLGLTITLEIFFTSAYLVGRVTNSALLFAAIIYPIMFAAGYAKDFLDFDADKAQKRKNLLT
ncbi:MAG: UbiA family prenyltransferase, partial [Candidatus Diapherotrites archaeon]|nr:UbiA family prenyltransferase [Candidatus Diapherotrites archaeon]